MRTPRVEARAAEPRGAPPRPSPPASALLGSSARLQGSLHEGAKPCGPTPRSARGSCAAAPFSSLPVLDPCTTSPAVSPNPGEPPWQCSISLSFTQYSLPLLVAAVEVEPCKPGHRRGRCSDAVNPRNRLGLRVRLRRPRPRGIWAFGSTRSAPRPSFLLQTVRAAFHVPRSFNPRIHLRSVQSVIRSIVGVRYFADSGTSRGEGRDDA